MLDLGETLVAPIEERPDGVELLRRMYEQAARELAKVQGGCVEMHPRLDEVDGFHLYHAINGAWGRAYEMSVALDWLLRGEVPIYTHTGAPKVAWVREYFAGPWPSEVRP